MRKEEIINSIAYCGLLCLFCRPSAVCSCRKSNNCGKLLSPDGCFQYNCCITKGINGCWECPEAPCGKEMLAEDKIKLRAFITCIKEDGIDRFAEYIVRNAKNGIIYHRNGYVGDYDLVSEVEVIKLVRTGLR